MNIYYATKNKSKVQSLRRDLKEYDIRVIQIPLDLYEPRSYDVVEIANKKIISAYDKIKKPTVVLDAGFYIYSIKGFPRAFVNFALETIGIEGILDLVKNIYGMFILS
jgi:inosine/xanthosine triphosphate pyrophosphatase family protein